MQKSTRRVNGARRIYRPKKEEHENRNAKNAPLYGKAESSASMSMYVCMK